MYLLIDTSEYNKIHLALFNEKQIEHKNYSGQNRELLNCIHKLFKYSHLASPLLKGRKPTVFSPLYKGGLRGVDGIMVVVGTGSFTSTRIACVVANIFAYALQIPLLAIKKNEIDKVQELIKKFEACPAKPGGRSRGRYLSATYSGEPNIGSPR